MNKDFLGIKEVVFVLQNYLFAILTTMCTVIPLLVIWWKMGVNAFHSEETTFGLLQDAKGHWSADTETIALLVPIAFYVFMNIARFLTVLVTANREKLVHEPSMTSGIIESESPRIILFYGATFALWLFAFEHSAKAQYWAFPTLLAIALASYTLVYKRYVYGYQLSSGNKGTKFRSNGENSNQKNEAPLNVARAQVSSIRFSDIYGNTEVKRRMLEAGHAITLNRKEGKAPRNGILLFGEPGNGKTVFAEALAGELNLPFLQLTNSDVASQWVGEKTVRIKAAFDQAIRNQPCVLLVDEIDSFIPDREGDMTSGNKEDRDVVNTLLTLLVDIRKSKVVVIAATNYMDRLDGAAVREGRFDFKVEITPPDEEARIGLLRNGMKVNMGKTSVNDDVIKNVAQRWNGFSAKRILAVTEEMPSYLADMKEKTPTRSSSLAFDDFMAALRRIQGRKGVSPENIKTMDELILPPQTKEALKMISGRLADPVRVERLGGTMPTGVLFYGPPGTGKTVAAKALAHEVGAGFLISTGADLARDPKKLEKLYSQAKELRPCIIFIDEADDLLRSREYSSNTESTNKLLTLMDGVNDRVRDVVWVAATNNPDQIDAALLRGGRFTEKVEFVRPDNHQLIKHIAGWLGKRKIKLAAGLSAQSIGELIGDQSIANAEAVLQHAVNRAISHTTGNDIEITPMDVNVGLSSILGETV